MLDANGNQLFYSVSTKRISSFVKCQAISTLEPYKFSKTLQEISEWVFINSLNSLFCYSLKSHAYPPWSFIPPIANIYSFNKHLLSFILVFFYYMSYSHMPIPRIIAAILTAFVFVSTNVYYCFTCIFVNDTLLQMIEMIFSFIPLTLSTLLSDTTILPCIQPVCYS
jgi:hypothetical protein